MTVTDIKPFLGGILFGSIAWVLIHLNGVESALVVLSGILGFVVVDNHEKIKSNSRAIHTLHQKQNGDDEI